MDERGDFSRFISGAAERLAELTDTARLYSLVKAEELKKQELYYRLGKKYYSLFKDSPESDLKEIVDRILSCDDKIAELKVKLSDPGDSYRDVEATDSSGQTAETRENGSGEACGGGDGADNEGILQDEGDPSEKTL